MGLEVTTHLHREGSIVTMDATSAEGTIHPFFADAGTVVKVDIGERLVGADAVTAGLRQ